MESKDDLMTLLLHYRMIRDNTELLMQLCGMRGVSLADGYRGCTEAIMELEHRLKDLKE